MDFLALDFLTECIRISLNLKILVKKLFVYGLLEFFFLERNVFRGGGGEAAAADFVVRPSRE